MNSSCADILLFAAYKWNVSKPSLLADSKYTFVEFYYYSFIALFLATRLMKVRKKESLYF